MPPEVAESTISTTQSTETPSYSPPANEPQGLESGNAPDPAPDTKATHEAEPEGKASTIKLPASIKAPVKSGRFQERLTDLAHQRDMSKREADQLREQLSKMQSVARPSEPSATPKPDGSPLNPEDFATYGDYVTALTTSIIKQQASANDSKAAQAKYEGHKQERMAQFNEHAAPLAQQYGEGFWDTITDPSLPVTEAMADAVMELDNLGPYTMLYLAAHRDESAKIASMNPRAATVAIGRLAAQLDYEIKHGGEAGSAEVGSVGTTTPTSGSTVPRPSSVPTPRGSSPNLNGTLPSDKDSVDDWLRKETDRLRRINPNARFYGSR